MDDCCILSGGSGSWAFEPLAEQLSGALRIPISAEPRRFNYLLCLESLPEDLSDRVFIPLASVLVASDKRIMATVFARHNVPTPLTVLTDSFADVTKFVAQHPESYWCLKFPTGCVENGHRLVTPGSAEPRHWPRPFIVQEFIRLERPEVYRIYAADRELFGWVARRFPAGRPLSPWVAHARGARYELAGEPPPEALDAARAALSATELYDTFGCVDLLRRPSGEWVVLEVGTDGLYNHVDRELALPELEAELLRRIAGAFWRHATRALANPLHD
jgi:glutathione synthase/RimK-type ligase-like ATP-grasp enzyme